MSRTPSPARSNNSQDETSNEGDQELDQLVLDEGASVPCRWTDCTQTFSDSSQLGKHCMDHVLACRPHYTCLWETCTRKGLPQASKSALITHLRMHTGDRPYKCDQTACDRAFTRQDALAKHKRLQHNLDIPMPGRGGNRKRKHSQIDNAPASSPAPPAPKVQDGPSNAQNSPSRSQTRSTSAAKGPDNVQQPSQQATRVPDLPAPPPPPPPPTTTTTLPPVHQALQMPAPTPLPPPLPHVAPPMPTNLPSLSETLHGIGHYKAAYIIEKAKLSYITKEHNELLDELRSLQHEESREYREKERMMDHVLRAAFPPTQIEQFLYERPPAP